ncbi:MAG: RES domain-containing protein [Oscillatoria princeps RMCB-10]|jgi:RES domain-containing protein|nr:RES domain-containing protein [Oscillatoria princeps RMCB-10]
MLTDNQLIAALASLPTLAMPGLGFRAVHIRHLNTCLSSIGSFRFGGRYNPPSAFEALYLADHPVTSLLEVEALLKARTELKSLLKPPQLLLYRISVERRSGHHGF